MNVPSPTAEAVSVIVPCFNGERFVHTALASIAAQTDQPGEVVVVDDASTDSSVEHIDRWRDLLPLTVVTKTTNEGLGAARHTGIAAARGSIICLLDIDDAWLPDHLSRMVGAMGSDKTIVSPAAYNWRPGEETGTVPSTSIIPIPVPSQQPLEILKANFLFSGSMFSKAAHDRVGGFSSRRKNEDWDLWIRMIHDGCRVVGLDAATVLYRQHSESLSVQDGCLPHDIDMLERLVAERSGAERAVAARALRRRRARTELVAGFAAAEAGRTDTARRLFVRAALIDRSFAGGSSSRNGSVLLRAVPGILSPSWSLSRRTERLANPNLDHGPDDRTARRPKQRRTDLIDLASANDIAIATEHPTPDHASITPEMELSNR